MNSGLARQRLESPGSRGLEDPLYQSYQSPRGVRENEAELLAAAQRQHQMNAQQSRRQDQLLAEQLAEQRRHQQEMDIQHQQALYEQEAQMHLLRMQQLEQQQQQQQHQQQQQMLQYAHRSTPPPRMLPTSQSPRFLEHQQRQILLLQQQQEQQQKLRLQELQEQLRMEDLERQLRGQHLSPAVRQEYGHARQPSADSHHRGRSHSPAQYGPDGQYLNSNSPQLQQRLLAQLAQAEFMREMQGMSEADQEALRVEAMRKIVETEKMEERRRRKAAKIAHMVSSCVLQGSCLTSCTGPLQRLDDAIRQGLHHSHPSFPACFCRSLRRRLLCSSVWCNHAFKTWSTVRGRTRLEVWC